MEACKRDEEWERKEPQLLTTSSRLMAIISGDMHFKPEKKKLKKKIVTKNGVVMAANMAKPLKYLNTIWKRLQMIAVWLVLETCVRI